MNVKKVPRTDYPSTDLAKSDLDPTQANRSPLQLLLRPEEAARALAISPRKLWDLTKRGEIPAVRIGRVVRYDIDGLREWILAQKEVLDR